MQQILTLLPWRWLTLGAAHALALSPVSDEVAPKSLLGEFLDGASRNDVEVRDRFWAEGVPAHTYGTTAVVASRLVGTTARSARPAGGDSERALVRCACPPKCGVWTSGTEPTRLFSRVRATDPADPPASPGGPGSPRRAR